MEFMCECIDEREWLWLKEKTDDESSRNNKYFYVIDRPKSIEMQIDRKSFDFRLFLY